MDSTPLDVPPAVPSSSIESCIALAVTERTPASINSSYQSIARLLNLQQKQAASLRMNEELDDSADHTGRTRGQ
eukprot:6179357-Pleurochrysis_carterae.AAC.2